MEVKKAISLELAVGTWRMKFEMTWPMGWQSKASQTVRVEFDGQPLGSLNAELYTILFSCLNTGTWSLERQRWKHYVCVYSHFFQMWKPGPGKAPGVVQKLLLGGQCIKWHLCERQCAQVQINSEPLEMQGPNCDFPTIDPQAYAHMKTCTRTGTLLHFLASL